MLKTDPIRALAVFDKPPSREEIGQAVIWTGVTVQITLTGADFSEWEPFNLVLFFGSNCLTDLRQSKGKRVVEVPALSHPRWTKKKLDFVGRLIREGEEDLEIRFDKETGQVIAETLVPF